MSDLEVIKQYEDLGYKYEYVPSCGHSWVIDPKGKFIYADYNNSMRASDLRRLFDNLDDKISLQAI